jgi:hypothetical protein
MITRIECPEGESPLMIHLKSSPSSSLGSKVDSNVPHSWQKDYLYSNVTHVFQGRQCVSIYERDGQGCD